MNTDVEDLLREGMERFTRDLRAPAGLTRRIRQRRRRRLALWSVAGGAAALTAGAVALVTVVVPGTHRSSAVRSVVLTAYVVKRVDGALSVVEPGEIAQMAVTRSAVAPGGKTVTTTAEEWSYGDQWRTVTNSPAGRPVYDEGFNSSSVYTLVSYLTRTWSRQSGLGRPAAPVLGPPLSPVFGLPPPAGFGLRPGLRFSLRPAPLFGSRNLRPLARHGCGPVAAVTPSLFQPGLPEVGFAALPGIGFSASVLPTAAALRSAISCGILTVAGRQRVDGVEAIELTSGQNSPIAETFWVSPDTYLPVRVVVRSALGFEGVRQTADITWLAPTAQNLAKLDVAIPTGFRQVSYPQAVLPMLQQIAAGLLPKPARLCLAGPGVQAPYHCVRLRPGA